MTPDDRAPIAFPPTRGRTPPRTRASMAPYGLTVVSPTFNAMPVASTVAGAAFGAVWNDVTATLAVW